MRFSQKNELYFQCLLMEWFISFHAEGIFFVTRYYAFHKRNWSDWLQHLFVFLYALIRRNQIISNGKTIPLEHFHNGRMSGSKFEDGMSQTHFMEKLNIFIDKQ